MIDVELPEGWELARADWPSEKLSGEIVALSPDGLYYRPVVPWGKSRKFHLEPQARRPSVMKVRDYDEST